MARTRVKKNIAYDDVRKTYYEYLHWGKDENGKSKDTSETTKNLKEAERILKKHQKEMAAGTAVMPVKNTLVDAVEAYIRYKELDLAKTTINGYKNILKNHIKRVRYRAFRESFEADSPKAGGNKYGGIEPIVRCSCRNKKRQQIADVSEIMNHKGCVQFAISSFL